jgi:hypothetical protein
MNPNHHPKAGQRQIAVRTYTLSQAVFTAKDAA